MSSRVAASLGIATLVTLAIAGWGILGATDRSSAAFTSTSVSASRTTKLQCDAEQDAFVKTPVPQTQRDDCAWYIGTTWVGHYITYVPPDNPYDGGYRCKGGCDDDPQVTFCCGASPAVNENNGVWSQVCDCYQSLE